MIEVTKHASILVLCLLTVVGLAIPTGFFIGLCIKQYRVDQAYTVDDHKQLSAQAKLIAAHEAQQARVSSVDGQNLTRNLELTRGSSND